ncbi:unnamed protein product [Cylicostephanus goldi]|uniref:Uncharacterized protein n=1 Tax=Cylicostephanus goldi TaxID=71465 RepID=A0A3P7PIG9_CYLGO|nr:unnamed protein product [Cylicostephanus goldi]
MSISPCSRSRLLILYYNLAPSCGCPPTNPSCPPQPGCQPIYGVTTHHVQTAPIALPDELEMRAAAFGIPVAQQHTPNNLEQFEKLVERQEAISATENSGTATVESPDVSVRLESEESVRRTPEERATPTVLFITCFDDV